MYIAVYLFSILTTTTQPLVLNIKNLLIIELLNYSCFTKALTKYSTYLLAYSLFNHPQLIVLVIMILSSSLYTFLIHLLHYIALFPLLLIFGILFYIPSNPTRQQTPSKVNYKHNLV